MIMNKNLRIKVVSIWFFMLIGVVYPLPMVNQQDELGAEAQAVVNMQQSRQTSNNENEDNTMNKNNGLINTIANHNEKPKVVENNINYIVNNFANSSHVKEIIDKTKEIERHVFGSPRPHSSWREFVLLSICLVAILCVLYKLGEKVVAPRLFGYLSKKTFDTQKGIRSVSEQVDRNQDNSNYEEIENKLVDLNSRLAYLTRTINERWPKTTNLNGNKD